MVSIRTSGVYARRYDELDGVVEVGFAGGRVIAVSFPESLPDDADADHALLDRIGEYLRGAEDSFHDVDSALTVATDRRGVLEALRQVPYGEEVSLSRLTRMAGMDDNDPDDLELTRAALSENPVPIVFADHRVQGGPYKTPDRICDRLRGVEGIR